VTEAASMFVESVTRAVKPLHRTYTEAYWKAATTGTKVANTEQKEAHAELMRFWANPERFETAKALRASRAASDPIEARQIERIYLSAAKAQGDEETIERLTQLEADVQGVYYNYRAEVGGCEMTDNQIDDVLRTSNDPEQAKAVWLASKQVGHRVAEMVRELARVRNRAAKLQGFRDHFQRALLLNEIDEGKLFSLFQELEARTAGLFLNYKHELDGAMAERFDIPREDLRPWHYGDRFFQQSPQIGAVELDSYFEDRDLQALAERTYQGLGIPVKGILERSDLYPREGKNQHAFCLDIDREGDVRTLNNLQPSLRWAQTLFHELGHAVYDRYIDRDLPWLLRTPPHPSSTEAIAMMMGALTFDGEWLTGILRLSAGEAAALAAEGARRERGNRLVFTRWCLVMTHFERALYADPEADLDVIWWELVERHQMIRCPDDLISQAWAAKYHIALAPVYYQNYELGHLMRAQLEARILEQFGGLAEREKAGEWLIREVFQPGAQQDWKGHLERATGARLSLGPFLSSLVE
jgi:peptidyl-dipeptidase A